MESASSESASSEDAETEAKTTSRLPPRACLAAGCLSVAVLAAAGLLFSSIWASGCPDSCPPPPVAVFRAATAALAGGPLTWDAAQARADELSAQMTSCEKYGLMQGMGWANYSSPSWGYYVGNTLPVPRLGIPSLNFMDAGGGFRTIWPALVGTVTCWPSSLALAATWDAELVRSVSVALGKEFSGKGANAVLGPSINLQRVARGGRNFEYLSTEDPYLGSKLAVAYVEGVHSQGVLSVIKHWALNSQETNRDSASQDADEQTRWELYYPPFEAAVEAGAVAAMCSYNKLDGSYACSNSHELQTVLKGKMGFRGFVQSDWWATHATSVREGLDQEMPGPMPGHPTSNYFCPARLSALDANLVNVSARRILTAMYRLDLFGNSRCNPPYCDDLLYSKVTSAEHAALARDAAAQSVVLLKNAVLGDGAATLLPLNAYKAKTIAVVGAAAATQPFDPSRHPQSKWHQGDYYSGGGSGHVTAGYVVTPLEGITARAASVGIKVISSTTSDAALAAAVARQADVTIVVAATTSGESVDRSDLSLDDAADALVEAVTAVAHSTVVAVMAPGAVVMPWKDSVGAIAMMFLGGQETGNAWADVLFGDVAPAGRLPIMLPATEMDSIAPSTAETVVYAERMGTSYRNPEFVAAFPFGHGLTYTSFSFGAPVTVECLEGLVCLEFGLRNAGPVAAKAVPQVYLEFPWDCLFPSPVLKGFQKTGLIQPGASVRVHFEFHERDLSCYKAAAAKFVRASNWTAHIGASSGDIWHTLPLVLPGVDT